MKITWKILNDYVCQSDYCYTFSICCKAKDIKLELLKVYDKIIELHYLKNQ
jgi:hypothetical protein